MSPDGKWGVCRWCECIGGKAVGSDLWEDPGTCRAGETDGKCQEVSKVDSAKEKGLGAGT